MIIVILFVVLPVTKQCAMSKCEQCVVREFSALKALTKDELVTMSSCKTATTIKKGESLFVEGDNVNGVFCIKEGVCKMTKLSANGKDQIVKLTQRGELLGQRSLISDEPANLSAIAIEDMEVCFIPKSDILNFFNNNNAFSMSLMKSVCADLKDADDMMVNLAQKNVKERLAQTLIYLEEKFGVTEDKSLRLQLSREEIASIIGTATESCIRLLSEFKKAGLIELNGKKITILDKVKLKRIME